MDLHWRCGRYEFDLGARPLIMGILNVTPDSFSDGYPDVARAAAHGEALIEAGADILDIGGESTRPNAEGISLEEELARVLPVIDALNGKAPLSLDTQKAAVAREAVRHGVSIINHVSGLLDLHAMLPVLAASEVGYVGMHMPARPKHMQAEAAYGDVVGEVTTSMLTMRDTLIEAGVAADRCLYDPGIGFGKHLAHNLALMGSVHHMASALGRPLLMGISRKSWLAALLKLPVEQRDPYTMAAGVLFPFPAVAVHRVHNVEMMKNCLRIKESIQPFRRLD